VSKWFTVFKNWLALKWYQLRGGWKDDTIFELLDRVETLENDLEAVKTELGTIYTHCDKCKDGCFKCGNTGVIKRNQLMEWQW
jgi:hypothetical protein